MNLEYFPNFMRMNFPKCRDESNDTLNEIGEEFKKYLQEVFVADMQKLDDIWNIDLKNVIKNINHPFFVRGYHPALIIHFDNFVKKNKDA